jgi:hypothetical protein
MVISGFSLSAGENNMRIAEVPVQFFILVEMPVAPAERETTEETDATAGRGRAPAPGGGPGQRSPFAPGARTDDV